MARFAKALSHPVWIAILQLLASQECCYHGDMSEVLPVAKSTLSQHLNELKDAGFDMISVGKINDIFDTEGVTEAYKSKSNEDGMNITIKRVVCLNFLIYQKSIVSGIPLNST